MRPIPPKLIPLSHAIPGGLWALALRKFKALEQLRLERRLPISKKIITIGANGFAIIISSDFGSKIMINNAVADALIALGGIKGLFGYNYYSHSFVTLNNEYSSVQEILPLSNKGIIAASSSLYTKTNLWKEDTSLTGIDNIIEKISYDDVQRVSHYLDSNNVYELQNKSLTKTYALPSSVITGMSGCSVENPVVVTHPSGGEDWNLAHGADVYNIQTSSTVAFTWVPNVFFAYPANNMFHRSGVYYGERYQSPYSTLYPMEEIEIYFKGVSKFLASDWDKLYSYGYFEVVGDYKIDYPDYEKEEACDLFCYFSTSPPTTYSNSTDFYQYGMTISMDIATITCGDSGKGARPTFRISLDRKLFDPETLTVDSWVIHPWTEEFSLSLTINSAFGAVFIVVVDGTNMSLYRYSGYSTVIYKTKNYMTHSVSNDGMIICIHVSDHDGDRIITYDLYGEKEEGGNEYVGVGVTLIAEDIVPTKMIPLDISIIPPAYEKKDDEYVEQSTGRYTVAGPTQLDSLPSMAQVKFQSRGNKGFGISKIIIEGGVKASLVTSYEECMSTVVIVEEDSTNSDHLLATTQRFASARGDFRMRGIFDGKEEPSFSGEGSAKYTITMPEHFSMYGQLGTHAFAFGDHSGDVIPGECTKWYTAEETSIVMDIQCGVCEKVDGVWQVVGIAETTCGQTASYIQKLDKLRINGPGEVDEGSRIQVAGGSGVYTFHASQGSFTRIEDTNYWECTDASGICGTIKFTVNDPCGDTVTHEARSPTGYWETTWEDMTHNLDWTLQQVVIDGGIKTTYIWMRDGATYSDQVLYTASGECYGQSRTDIAPSRGGQVVYASDSAICGEDAPSPYYDDVLDGTVTAISGYSTSGFTIYINFGNSYGIVGWAPMTINSAYGRVERWVCP